MAEKEVKAIKVKTLSNGYIGKRRVPKGAVVMIHEHKFSSNWMEKVEDGKKEPGAPEAPKKSKPKKKDDDVI